MKRITTKAELVALAYELGVRADWHEPDEQEISAIVRGVNFDNAGFWPSPNRAYEEMYVTIYKDCIGVAEVNLAALFAWATGLED